MVDTQLNKASAFSFQLTFPMVPIQKEVKEGEELVLNIYDTIIPGITLGFNEERWQGAKSIMSTGIIDFSQWNITFGVDSEFKNWKMLYNWMMFVNNNKNRYIKKHSIYSVDATLSIIDNFKANIFSLRFIDVWPNNLGDVSLNYREGESNLECSATFAYDRYEIKDQINI